MEQKKLCLMDGTEIVIRDLAMDDLDMLMDFYTALPGEDRRFLRVDVTNRDIVTKRLELMLGGSILRITALHKNSIIADGALELPNEEWRKGQAEIRVIVARPYQRRGLGLIMMRELCFLAEQHHMETLIVKMMKAQLGARKICRKLGFRKKTVIHDYVLDLQGKHHDLLIMTRKVKDMWQDLSHFYDDTDWQRCR